MLKEMYGQVRLKYSDHKRANIVLHNIKSLNWGENESGSTKKEVIEIIKNAAMAEKSNIFLK